MSRKRLDRINELLRHEIANGLYHVQTSPPLDLARITISSVDCLADLRKAKVMVSVLEDEAQQTTAENVVRVLNLKRKDFQKLIATNVVLKFTPHLQFFEDHGQEHANRIYEILDALPPIAEDLDADEGKSDVSAEG
jgi:ribosome-binding factor A